MIISLKKFKDEVFPKSMLLRSSLLHMTYKYVSILVIGEIADKVKYGAQQCSLALTVVPRKGIFLLGHDWLKHIKLDWMTIDSMKVDYNKTVLDMFC